MSNKSFSQGSYIYDNNTELIYSVLMYQTRDLGADIDSLLNKDMLPISSWTLYSFNTCIVDKHAILVFVTLYVPTK